MYYFIVYVLLFTVLASFPLGIVLGSAITYLNTFMLFITLIFTQAAFHEILINNYTVTINYLNWFYSLNFYFNFDLIFDKLSTTMLYVVIFISFCVHSFSIYYIKGDPNYNKFFFYLTCFTFFMCILVLSNNMLQFFLGWEGIGLFSYLLINFWSTRLEANRSSIKAIIVNKIGDCFLYIFLIFYFIIFDNFDIAYNDIFSLGFFNVFLMYFNATIYDILISFVLLCSIAKSAQIGLHVWLPDAMEGPTPVSALLHAATMVTAGVYMLLRLSWILDLSNLCYIFAIFGLLTNFFTSFTSFIQLDFKKIVAYSTASQISLMFLASGFSMHNIAFFHLFNHAFFKALLFLSCGVIIHIFSNLQDSRTLEQNLTFDSFINSIFLVGQLTLIGFPFLSSFYSKDLIIQSFYINENFMYSLFSFCIDFSLISTTLYTFKLANDTIISEFYLKIYNEKYKNKLKECLNYFYAFPLYVLALMSIFSGYIFSVIFTEKNSFYFSNIFIFNEKSFIFVNNFNYSEMSSLSLSLISFSGLVFTETFVNFLKKNFYFDKKFYNFIYSNLKKFYFDVVYYYFVTVFFDTTYDIFYKILDKIGFEYNTNKNQIIKYKKLSSFFSFMQKGQIFFYISVILAFLVCYFLIIFLYRYFFYFVFMLIFDDETIFNND